MRLDEEDRRGARDRQAGRTKQRENRGQELEKEMNGILLRG